MLNDLRYALRQLVKAPSFTIVAILTLALGIGACTAIFSVVNVVLLRPLDYPQPDRIVNIRETNLPQFPEFSVSPPNYIDWEKQTKSYEYLAAYSGARVNLTGDGEPQQLLGVKATAHYFDVFGVKPVLGRMLLPEEDAQGKNHVVVLSYPFWQRVFGGAYDVVGRAIQLNGEPYTVVGIAPAGFGQASKVDAWMPMAFKPDETANDARGGHYINVVGRLRPGVTVAQARAELEVLATQLAKQYPDSNKGWGIFMMPIQDYTVRDVKLVLYTLLGAVGCVLLIACEPRESAARSRHGALPRDIHSRGAWRRTRETRPPASYGKRRSRGLWRRGWCDPGALGSRCVAGSRTGESAADHRNPSRFRGAPFLAGAQCCYRAGLRNRSRLARGARRRQRSIKAGYSRLE
jgi:putative ABC transport system permease protein